MIILDFLGLLGSLTSSRVLKNRIHPELVLNTIPDLLDSQGFLRITLICNFLRILKGY